jgi:hypothetical protein
MGKTYRQPKVVKTEKGGGYPITDIGLNDVMVKGRWMSGTKQKIRRKMRGSGAATKGFMYYDDEQD